MEQMHCCQKYVLKMKEIREKYKYDEEVCHSEADKLLVDFIKEFGFAELAYEYDQVPKWYA